VGSSSHLYAYKRISDGSEQLVQEKSKGMPKPHIEDTHTISIQRQWEKEWPQTVSDFEQFVELYHDRLYQFVYYRVKNRQDAEDIVQSIFFKAFDKRKQFRRVTKHVGSYLFRMGYNACIDHLRKAIRKPTTPLEPHHVIELPNPNSDRHLMDEWDRIEAILDRIPKKQAEVVRLRVVDSFTFGEIAKILRTLETTVRTRYRYGVQKIREIVLRSEE
jgi:RNA polymerase sigma-70 factor (ECF subfamily)